MSFSLLPERLCYKLFNSQLCVTHIRVCSSMIRAAKKGGCEITNVRCKLEIFNEIMCDLVLLHSFCEPLKASIWISEWSGAALGHEALVHKSWSQSVAVPFEDLIECRLRHRASTGQKISLNSSSKMNGKSYIRASWLALQVDRRNNTTLSRIWRTHKNHSTALLLITHLSSSHLSLTASGVRFALFCFHSAGRKTVWLSHRNNSHRNLSNKSSN
jgi:hypothetical protein